MPSILSSKPSSDQFNISKVEGSAAKLKSGERELTDTGAKQNAP